MTTYIKLTNTGKIPLGQFCPYKDQCHIAEAGACNHGGPAHQVEFSCGAARAFDMCATPEKEVDHENI